ncbi:MAG: hypothetical protein K0R53_1297 [Burkholderiales bacterium]|nr:hypothetical protein [Burkholderiales bacterium]
MTTPSTQSTPLLIGGGEKCTTPSTQSTPLLIGGGEKVLPSFIRRGGTEGDGVVDIFLDDFDLEVT